MKNFMCFDIGGTSIKYGVLKENGEIIEKDSCDTEAYNGGKSILSKIKNIVNKFINKYSLSGICISTAGIVNSEEGSIIFASELIPEYTGMKLKLELEKEFNLRVEVENDVNCVGLAEAYNGVAKGFNSVFSLTIGTGIGGSIIIDNKLYTGNSFSAAEIGYMNINGNDFQDVASTRSLVEKVNNIKNTKENKLNGKDIFRLVKNNDKDCIKAVDDLLENLSIGISNIALILNPEIIVIGGGIASQDQYLYPILVEKIEGKLIPYVFKNTRIAFAKNQNNAGIIGALSNFLSK